MIEILINLADLHYKFGLIDYDEFNERYEVALWLADESCQDVVDPRADGTESCDETEGSGDDVESRVECITSKENEQDWLEFLFNREWVFTKSDEDSYPSVPHGHNKHQNMKWPKLNPYTGRVFSGKHQEVRKKRLSKEQMQALWTDEKFRSFCREMIVWYLEHQPHYRFPVSQPLRLPRW